jgi:hypothetical protein
VSLSQGASPVIKRAIPTGFFPGTKTLILKAAS